MPFKYGNHSRLITSSCRTCCTTPIMSRRCRTFHWRTSMPSTSTEPSCDGQQRGAVR